MSEGKTRIRMRCQGCIPAQRLLAPFFVYDFLLNFQYCAIIIEKYCAE